MQKLRAQNKRVIRFGHLTFILWIYFGLTGWPPQPPRVRVSKINKIVGFWFLIHSTLRDQDRSLWCHGWCDGNIKLSNFFEAVEVIEATEAIKAVKVIETTDILRPGKLLLSTPELSRFLNLALFWCFENHLSIFAHFLLKAVEASLGYFFENWF